MTLQRKKWRKYMVPKRIAICKVMILSMFFLLPGDVQASDPFAGITLEPAAKTYLVIKDINVRAGPKTKSARVGRLRKREQIKAAGKAKGTEWIAIKKNGKNFGFVYGTALVQMIDGRLSNPIRGNLESQTIEGQYLPPCHFKIRFDGKSKVEKELQITSDYILDIECDYKKNTIKINASMFLTELPYLKPKDPTYQINVDLYNDSIVDDNTFSVTVLYNTLNKEIKFEGGNIKEVLSKVKIGGKKVMNLSAALKGAVVMAHQSWGPRIWSELEKKIEK